MDLTVTFEDVNDYCLKCKNLKSCKRPCRFVEDILSEGNRAVMEKHYEHRGEFKIRNFGQKRMIRFSEMDEHETDQFEYDTSDVYVPERTLNAKVFFLHFFKGLSYGEIAKKLNIERQHVLKTYSEAKKRINKIMEYLDRSERAKLFFDNKSHVSLTEVQKMFILQYCMNLSISQIAALHGKKTKSAISNKLFRYKNACLDGMA
jgi:predicted DNA-binding protein YlxM (UPF0122 family)